MGDRYRHARPHSPRLHDPMRSSMPTVGHSSHYGELHAIPLRREVITTPRSSSDRVHAPGPITTTTYKITQDPAARSSSIRAGSRARSSTVDSTLKPAVIATPRHRPTVHHGGSGKPASPIYDNYRSSGEGDYLSIPGSSGRHRSRHRTYSATLDNGDRIKTTAGREAQAYPGSRSRPTYTGTLVRHPDTKAEEYGKDGYGYTNPRDLVQYDLNHTPHYSHRARDSSQTRARPSSVSGYHDLAPRSFDNRERGPPPSTRGFDRIVTRPSFDQPSPRPQVIVEPDARPHANSRSRPVAVYHEREPQRHRHSEEYYDPRDSDLRDRRERVSRHDRYDDGVDRGHHSRPEKREHEDRSDKFSGKDALAAGLSLAASAFGLGAVANSGNAKAEERDERDEHRRRRDESDEERRRRKEAREPREDSDEEKRRRHEREYREDSDEEKRRRREREYREDSDEEKRRRREREYRDERQPADVGGREAPDRHRRDERAAVDDGRENRDSRPRRDERGYPDAGPRGSRENVDMRDDRVPSDDHSRHDRHKNPAEPISGARVDPREGSPASEDSQGRTRRILPPAAFNPRDTMDIRALKEALNAQDSRPKELASVPVAASAREASFDPQDPRELRDLQTELNTNAERPKPKREITPPEQSKALRVVEPPREKPEEKPVKGILRQPRDKFPEDPSPIREGVAPLKDAKKDGVPPDARWTKIDRKLVNPAALELGKERYEARDEFVIVLRVLSKEEVQAYATKTQQIRAEREEEEARERRRRRRERHERHKREGRYRYDDDDYRRHRRRKELPLSESDTTESDRSSPRLLDAPPKTPKKIAFEEPEKDSAQPPYLMSGGLGNLKEDPMNPGTYSGYSRGLPVREPRDRE